MSYFFPGIGKNQAELDQSHTRLCISQALMSVFENHRDAGTEVSLADAHAEALEYLSEGSSNCHCRDGIFQRYWGDWTLEEIREHEISGAWPDHG